MPNLSRSIKTFFVFAVLFFTYHPSFAQSDYDVTEDGVASVNGYVDAYYAHYTDSVGLNADQKFPFVNPQSDKPGLNMAMISARYEGEGTRGVIALQYGDIPRTQWSSQLNPVMEAHVGLRIVNGLWIDGGLFRSHMATERLLPRENFCSSASVNRVYESHYESGFRLEFLPGEGDFSMDAYLLTGYNMFGDNNRKKSFGFSTMYRWDEENGKAGYNLYYGDDTPEAADTINHLRVQHSAYVNFNTFFGMRVQLGGDYATQRNSSLAAADQKAKMYGGTLNLKYTVFDRFSVYGRGEIFHDRHGFVSTRFIDSKGNITGYKMWGMTGGVEFKPTGNSYIRVEYRRIIMDKDQKIFYWDGKQVSTRNEIGFNLGLQF
ncbi:MAG TPA: outer membrane beta-barrel protein [Bacteroidia bacterium]|jgi:hypothetical protein|nr:outer membrane beta-barrel protein [Bacteroidia bacterium]